MSPAKKENTIYVRPRTAKTYPEFKFEAMAKAQGEGVIVGGYTRLDAVIACGQMLWAIDQFGPKNWRSMAPIDRLPGIPEVFDYPVIDEK